MNSSAIDNFVDPVGALVDPLSTLQEPNDFIDTPVSCAVQYLMSHEGYTHEQALSLVQDFISNSETRQSSGRKSIQED